MNISAFLSRPQNGVLTVGGVRSIGVKFASDGEKNNNKSEVIWYLASYYRARDTPPLSRPFSHVTTVWKQGGVI